LGPHRDAGLSPGLRTAIVSFFSAKGEHEATLCPPLDATVGFMKRRLADLCGIPVECQRVMLGSQAVADGETLLTLGMPTELTLARVQVETHEPGTSLLHVVVDGEEGKLEALLKLLDVLGDGQIVLYCNDRCRVLRLAQQLRGAGVTSAELHGDLEQRERERTVEAFHSGSARVLALTDAVAPRFLGDMRPVPVILNYDFPGNLEDFGRRVFRSGRFSRRGVAVSLVHRGSAQLVRDAERFYCVRIPELGMEDREELAERLGLSGRLVPEGHAERFHRAQLREQPWKF